MTTCRALSLAAISGLLLTTSFHSLAEVTANVSATSNYYWRGVTQTNDRVAVSGGVDYANENGFYAGAWVSNVDFGETTSSSYELDLYGGFSGSVDDLGYDLGYIYYAYPDASDDINFSELYGALSWHWLEAKASYLVAADSAATSEEDMLYLELNASFDVFTDATFALHLGQSSGDTVQEWFGEDDYLDFGASLSKSGFTLGFVKTNLEDNDIKAYVSYSLDFDL